MSKPLSSCCGARAKINMVRKPGEPVHFCDKCLKGCEVVAKKSAFAPKVKEPTGERKVFVKLYHKRAHGVSEISGEPLLPPSDPMFHFQGCHLLPKGTYEDERLIELNIVMTTVDEHMKEWPRVKEKTDAQLIAMGMQKWIVKVTLFRALRLKSNTNLKAKLSGTNTHTNG